MTHPQNRLKSLYSTETDVQYIIIFNLKRTCETQILRGKIGIPYDSGMHLTTSATVPEDRDCS